MDLKFIVFKYTYFHILSDVLALYTTELQLFKCSDGPPLSCRFDPANPHIQLGESDTVLTIQFNQLINFIFHISSVCVGRLPTQP